MQDFDEILQRAAYRKGGEQALRKLLPTVTDSKSLRTITDDRYLSQMTQCVFNAGFHWGVISKKWPDFETAFHGFNIRKLLLMSPEQQEAYVSDARVVRNWQKLKTVWENAMMIQEIAEKNGSFAAFFADWPCSDQIGLMSLLKKQGARLGGNTGQYFIRFMGKDSFVTSRDMCAALIESGLDIKGAPSSQSDFRKIQTAFNEWHEQSGLPYTHISRILAYSTGINYSAKEIPTHGD